MIGFNGWQVLAAFAAGPLTFLTLERLWEWAERDPLELPRRRLDALGRCVHRAQDMKEGR